MTTHVVQFSSGIGSWAAARRVANEHGTQDLVLLFADTKVEDEDNYRFLRDAATNIGVPVTIVADGRTPQEVMRDQKFIGNSRIAPCSHLLKHGPCLDWLTESCDPDDTILYVGIDWTEMDRIPAIERNWAPWRVEFPMCDRPYLTKEAMRALARDAGLEPPRLYAMGFPHANCGGACVRAGQAQWSHLLRANPALFASWEDWEGGMRADLGDVSILRDRRGAETKPLPLVQLRGRVESGAEPEMFDPYDWGGCGCMTSDDPAVTEEP